MTITEPVMLMIATVYAAAQLGLLTAIFFRLGVALTEIKALFRRVIALEEKQELGR